VDGMGWASLFCNAGGGGSASHRMMERGAGGLGGGCRGEGDMGLLCGEGGGRAALVL
jgi:hypothetical protein